MRRFPVGLPRSRTALLLAFAVVVLALALVDGLVLLAAVPELRSLRDMANDDARAVEVATQIRARISAARRDLLAALRSRSPGEGRDAAEVPAAFARLRLETEALLPRAQTGAARAVVTSLGAALGRCEEEARRLEADLERDRLDARSRVQPFLELTWAADEAADRVVSLDAAEVEDLSRSVRAHLAWTSLGATALAVAGIAGAVLLLRRALRSLAGEQAAASARSADLEAFAARAAHELRTPLQTVALALRALERGSGPRALDKARRSADRLRETVDGLLEFSRAGVAPGREAAADLGSVVGEVREELAPHLAAARVAFEVDVPPGTNVAMATAYLATVLRNVVGNAVKHGEGCGCIRVRAQAAAGAVHVEVADDGPGIPPEALPRVFEPFFRATTKIPGHGLGLATVRRLVEAHHGAVRIRSAPGHGTTVVLDLPGAAAPARATPGARS